MTVLHMSLWATLIILITAAIRFAALHKIPKTAFLIMWGLALLRLLIPFSFDISPRTQATDISTILPINVIYEALTQNTQGIAQTAAPTITPGTTSFPWITFIWAAVAVGLLLYFIAVHIRYRKIYKMAVPIKSAFADCWQQENKQKRASVKIKVSPDISTPLTYGVFRPIILIPKTMDLENREQLNYILTHEMTHIKRLDPLWKLLLLVGVCVHWFNPFVWIMYALAIRDLEITCDEKSIGTLGADRKKPYALTLIELSQKQAKIIPFGSAFNKSIIKERTIAILKMKKITFAGTAAALLLVGAITAILVTSAFSTNSEILESNISHSGTELPPIPADLDESIRSLIFHEVFNQYGEFAGYERLISVGPSSENNYTAEQWQAILTAVDMGIVLWDETPAPVPVITERGRRLIDLSESSFTGNPSGLDHVEFFSDKLTITFAETYPEQILAGGAFYLYDTNDESAFVGWIAFAPHIFQSYSTSLSPDTTYILVARGIYENAIFKVSNTNYADLP